MFFSCLDWTLIKEAVCVCLCDGIGIERKEKREKSFAVELNFSLWLRKFPSSLLYLWFRMGVDQPHCWLSKWKFRKNLKRFLLHDLKFFKESKDHKGRDTLILALIYVETFLSHYEAFLRHLETFLRQCLTPLMYWKSTNESSDFKIDLNSTFGGLKLIRTRGRISSRLRPIETTWMIFRGLKSSSLKSMSRSNRFQILITNKEKNNLKFLPKFLRIECKKWFFSTNSAIHLINNHFRFHTQKKIENMTIMTFPKTFLFNNFFLSHFNLQKLGMKWKSFEVYLRITW